MKNKTRSKLAYDRRSKMRSYLWRVYGTPGKIVSPRFATTTEIVDEIKIDRSFLRTMFEKGEIDISLVTVQFVGQQLRFLHYERKNLSGIYKWRVECI